MKKIKTISDQDFGLEKSDNRAGMKEKIAARMVLFDGRGRIAILFVENDNIYKLPGGGTENLETIQETLIREIAEETGYTAELTAEIGLIEEEMGDLKLRQKSFCYIGKTVAKISKPKFTEEEQKLGFKLFWMTLDSAINKIQNCKPQFYRGQFIQKRDLLILQKAHKMLHNNVRFIVLEHAETIQNLNKICTGQLPGELSENGVLEAKELAKKLSKYRIDSIYSSDLTRAVETAREIQKKLNKLAVKPDKRLRERYFGPLEGKKFPEKLDWSNLPAGVETQKELDDRAEEFVDEILSTHRNKTVLIVCHSGIKASLLKASLHREVSWKETNSKKIWIIKNTKVII